MDYKNDAMQAAAAQDYMEVQPQNAGAAGQAQQAAVQPQAVVGQQAAVQPQYTAETAYQPQYTTETAYQPQPYDSQLDDYYEEQYQTAKNLGAAALGLSIGGFMTGWFGLGLLLDLVAIALGAISINKNRYKKGLGIAAISVASLGFLLTMLIYGFAFNEWRENGGLEGLLEDEPVAITQDYDYDFDTDYDDVIVPQTQSQSTTAKAKEKIHY